MSQKKDRIRASITTITIHLLLLIGLLFLGLSTPLPLPEEEGVEVNLGYSDMGSGTIQSIKPLEQAEPTAATATPKSSEQIDEDIVEEDNEEVPAIQEKPAEKPKQEKFEEPEEVKEVIKEEVKPEPIVEKKPEPKPKPVVDPRLMYTGKKVAKGESQEGPDKTPGDKGKETGDINSKGYDGLGGLGNGISFSLGNRKAKTLPKPKYISDDQGSVVVSIYVNKQGKVIRAEIMQKGTSVTDIELRKMARNAAMKASFTPDMDAAEVQKGTITYKFIKLN